MVLTDIRTILNATVLCGEDRLSEGRDKAFASDLMSDILTLGDSFPVIITGLCTMQTIRTCEMGSLDVIIIARSKKPTAEMIELAKDNNMVLMITDFSTYKVCGLLWEAGMKPVY